MPAPSDDLTLLLEAARAAGDIAMRHFREEPEVWDKGGSAGPVTEADLAVDAMLRARLLKARPDYGWLSEETEDTTDRLTCEHVFIIDPIDGTRSFIEGSQTWAHSLAVARGGIVTAAVVLLPARGLTYAAARGKGATCNGAPMCVAVSASLDKTEVLSSKVNLRPEFWRADPPTIQQTFRSSLAYRLAAVAEGRFGAMLTLRETWEWDIAAGTLLVEEAGGTARTTIGTPKFNTPSAALPGLIAGAPQLVDTLMAHGPKLSGAA